MDVETALNMDYLADIRYLGKKSQVCGTAILVVLLGIGIRAAELKTMTIGK